MLYLIYISVILKFFFKYEFLFEVNWNFCDYVILSLLIRGVMKLFIEGLCFKFGIIFINKIFFNLNFLFLGKFKIIVYKILIDYLICLNGWN